MANKNLASAKKAKYDEFYTQYDDIEREINAYLEFNPEVFKNKTIFLPCDDPEWSNFTKFFAQNFEKLQLKKLIRPLKPQSYLFRRRKRRAKFRFKIQDCRFEGQHLCAVLWLFC